MAFDIEFEEDVQEVDCQNDDDHAERIADGRADADLRGRLIDEILLHFVGQYRGVLLGQPCVLFIECEHADQRLAVQRGLLFIVIR